MTTVLEMAFAGEIGCGLDVNIPAAGGGAMATLFAEEVRIKVVTLDHRAEQDKISMLLTLVVGVRFRGCGVEMEKKMCVSSRDHLSLCVGNGREM